MPLPESPRESLRDTPPSDKSAIRRVLSKLKWPLILGGGALLGLALGSHTGAFKAMRATGLDSAGKGVIGFAPKVAKKTGEIAKEGVKLGGKGLKFVGEGAKRGWAALDGVFAPKPPKP